MTLLRYNQAIDLTDQELDLIIGKGIQTIQSFLTNDANYLSHLTSISSQRIKSNQEKLLNHYSSSIKSAEIVFQIQLANRFFYSTGCQKLDDMLKGGILSGEITEIVGHSGSGKSQFLLHLSLQTAIASSELILIETNCSFASERLYQMLIARRLQHDVETILKKIHVYKVVEMHLFLSFINSFSHQLTNPDSPYFNIKMILIDSLIFPFMDSLNEYINTKRKSEALLLLKSFLQSLRSIFQNRVDIAIVVVNFKYNRLGFLWKNSCKVNLEFSAQSEVSKFEIKAIEKGRIFQKQVCHVLLTPQGFTDSE